MDNEELFSLAEAAGFRIARPNSVERWQPFVTVGTEEMSDVTSELRQAIENERERCAAWAATAHERDSESLPLDVADDIRAGVHCGPNEKLRGR